MQRRLDAEAKTSEAARAQQEEEDNALARRIFEKERGEVAARQLELEEKAAFQRWAEEERRRHEEDAEFCARLQAEEEKEAKRAAKQATKQAGRDRAVASRLQRQEAAEVEKSVKSMQAAWCVVCPHLWPGRVRGGPWVGEGVGREGCALTCGRGVWGRGVAGRHGGVPSLVAGVCVGEGSGWSAVQSGVPLTPPLPAQAQAPRRAHPHGQGDSLRGALAQRRARDGDAGRWQQGSRNVPDRTPVAHTGARTHTHLHAHTSSLQPRALSRSLARTCAHTRTRSLPHTRTWTHGLMRSHTHPLTLHTHAHILTRMHPPTHAVSPNPVPPHQCLCLKAESYRFALPEDVAAVALPHTKRVLDKVRGGVSALPVEGWDAGEAPLRSPLTSAPRPLAPSAILFPWSSTSPAPRP